MKSGAQELLQVLKTTTEAGGTQSAIGVVSPCSTCKNFLDMPADNRPMCPRRYWDRRAREAQDAGLTDQVPSPYLTRYGRSDTASGYENPVSWEAGKSRLVWVATLDENKPLLNIDGSLKNPGLLDAGVDTQFMACRHMPYVPLMREGSYYAGNQLVEWDSVYATALKLSQAEVDDPYAQVKISGFVQKITPLQHFMITPAKKTVNAQGL
jgi:hypothetical protein